MVALGDVKKLKVQELRDELEARNLDKSGTKPVLIERLEGALATESVAEHEVATQSGIVADEVEAVEVPAPGPEEVKPPPKHAPIQAPASKLAEGSAPAAAPGGPKASEADKRKARAERFGVVSDEDRKKGRAERFGLTNGGGPTKQTGATTSKSGIVAPALTEEEQAAEETKRKDRAARFNLPVAPAPGEDAAKLSERAKRFGLTNPADDIVKKNARAERFGAATDKGEMASKFEARAKRFASAATDGDDEAKKKARAARFATET